jgi:hypothetical protein
MPIQSKTTLKSYFEDGDKPTASNFIDLIDTLCDDTVYGSGWNGVTEVAPSKNAVYDKIESVLSYIDSAVVGLWDDRGNYNASVNTFPASGGSGTSGAVLKGDIWTVSVAGTLGGNAVGAGDTVRALVDTPGQTSGNWAIAEGNLGYTPLTNVLTSAKIFVGNGSNVATEASLSGDATISNTGSLTVANSAVIGKVLTGFSSGAGTVSATDTILQAIQKLDGNVNGLGSTYVKLINGNVDFIYYTSDSFSLSNDLGAFAKSWLFYNTTLTELGFNANYLQITTSGFQFAGAGVAFGNFTPVSGVCAESRTVSNSDIGLIIRGLGSGSVYTQTGDLTRWQSYNGTSATTIAKVDKDGNITAASFLLNSGGSLVPYRFFHEAPTNKTYTIDAKTMDGRTLLQIRGLKTVSGTCTIAIKINGTAVTWTGSVTTLSVSSVAQDVSVISGGTFATGDRITITVTSASTPVDLELTLK